MENGRECSLTGQAVRLVHDNIYGDYLLFLTARFSEFIFLHWIQLHCFAVLGIIQLVSTFFAPHLVMEGCGCDGGMLLTVEGVGAAYFSGREIC